MVPYLFYLLYFCQHFSYFTVINCFHYRTVRPKCLGRVKGSSSRKITGVIGLKSDLQDNFIHSFTVTCSSLTHWPASHSMDAFFTCPGSFWADLSYLFSTAVPVPWIICPGAAGLQNNWDLDIETTRDSNPLFNIYWAHIMTWARGLPLKFRKE